MSSFFCDKCRAEIIDTDKGCITRCVHYPLKKFKKIKDDWINKQGFKGFIEPPEIIREKPREKVGEKLGENRMYDLFLKR